MAFGLCTSKLRSKTFNHLSSHVAAAIERYSALAEDLDTLTCNLKVIIYNLKVITYNFKVVP